MNALEKKPKLLRVTTVDLSLDRLLRGQLGYLSRRYEVVAVASDTGLLSGVRQREGVRTVSVPMRRAIAPFHDVVSLWRLWRLLRRERPAILHANTPKGSLLAMAAGWAACVPVRIYLVTGLRYQGATGLFRRLLVAMERLSCALATHVLPEGEGVRRILLADGISNRPLPVLHHGNINGLDTAYYSVSASDLPSREEMRSRLGLSKDDFTFVFVGRIVRDKGMHELADALRRWGSVSPVRVLLVGNLEDELDPLEDADRQLFFGDDRVVMVGWQDDVRPFLLAADALVFPSYREGFPNAPMQAGAMGLPSIVTDINGCNEIVEHGRNGLVVPPRDGDALLGAMHQLEADRVASRRMGQQACRMVAERYERRDVWKALERFYDSLLTPQG